MSYISATAGEGHAIAENAMPASLLMEIIVVERVLVGVLWAGLIWAGVPSIINVLFGSRDRRQIGMGSVALIGAGILIFQWRTLLGAIPPVADPWVAIALANFLMSAVGIYLTRVLHAPPARQRILLLTHAGTFVILCTAGALAA